MVKICSGAISGMGWIGLELGWDLCVGLKSVERNGVQKSKTSKSISKAFKVISDLPRVGPDVFWVILNKYIQKD